MPIGEEVNEESTDLFTHNDAATRVALTRTTHLLKQCIQNLIVIESQKTILNKDNFDFAYNNCLLELEDIKVLLKTQPHTFSISMMLENITRGYNSFTHMIAAIDPYFMPKENITLPILPFKEYQTRIPTTQEIKSFNKILTATKENLRNTILRLYVRSYLIRLPRLPRALR